MPARSKIVGIPARIQLPRAHVLGYAATLVASSLVAITAGWMPPFGTQLSYNVEDGLRRSHATAGPVPDAVILAIDERTLGMFGGEPQLRTILTRALTLLHDAPPRAVAIDIVLADKLNAPGDLALADALHALPNVVLASPLLSDGSGWDDPRPEFRGGSVTVGHVHAQVDDDGICRQYPLAKVAGHDRRWALAAESFRRVSGEKPILESPIDVQVGSRTIPAAQADGWKMPIHFLTTGDPPLSAIPRVSVANLLADSVVRASLHGKIVFIGLTALSATTADRLPTPFDYMTGVDIQAQAYETIAQGEFYNSLRPTSVLLLCLAVALVTGLLFWNFAGWRAYILGALLLVVIHLLPSLLYRQHILLAAAPLLFSGWLTLIGAAVYQYFLTQGKLQHAEQQRSRYVQAIHFVTHEMRTPLTAIQGSSELMGRYNLNEDKRKQMAQMINAESKRLARMIQTFLDVERLSAGEMELKSEQFTLPAVLEPCLDRARVLAERKNITITADSVPEAGLTGDRELMEYAIYNLLTNAVKYSPAETEVRVSGQTQGEFLRLAVRDQGIGLTQKEIRRIFQKFYRTKSAEASGEVGTGIGLSIVEQIVVHHGGRIEVTSTPGKGSCFTLVLPQAAALS